MLKINSTDLPELDNYPASLRHAALALWGAVPESRSSASEAGNNGAPEPIFLSDKREQRRFWQRPFFNRHSDIAKEAA
ncbi:MAG: hypothetical protein C0429_06305 [Sphingopyxis sp.]|nr:hypothetical protein [Sphingopyxis sp.]